MSITRYSSVDVDTYCYLSSKSIHIHTYRYMSIDSYRCLSIDIETYPYLSITIDTYTCRYISNHIDNYIFNVFQPIPMDPTHPETAARIVARDIWKSFILHAKIAKYFWVRVPNAAGIIPNQGERDQYYALTTICLSLMFGSCLAPQEVSQNLGEVG